MPDVVQIGMDPTTGSEISVAVIDDEKALEDTKLSEVEDPDRQEKKLSLTEEEREKLLITLEGLIRDGKAAMAAKCELWDEIDMAYEAVLPERDFPFEGASSLCTPILKTKLRAVASTIHEFLTATKPLLPLEPMESGDEQRTKDGEEFLDYDARVNMKLVETAYHLLLDVAKYGTSIVKVPWAYETELVTETRSYDGKLPEDVAAFAEEFQEDTDYESFFNRLLEGEKIRLNVEYEKEIYRGPKPQRVERRRFITPKGYRDPDRMPYWFEEIDMSWYELEDGVRDDRYDQAQLDKIKERHLKESPDKTTYIEKKYTVYEGKYLHETSEWVREKCLFTLIPEEHVLLRGLKYPYTHGHSYYIPLYFMPDPNDIDGEALGNDLLELQQMMNMIFNTVVDCDAANFPVYAYTGERGREFGRETWYPMKMYTLKQGESINQLRTSSFNSQSLQLLDYTRRMTDDVSTVSEAYTGGESRLDPNAPAAKTQMLLEMSQKGINRFAKAFISGWTEMTYQICELYSQYGVGDKQFRVLGEDGEVAFKAAPDDLRVRPDMVPAIGQIEFTRTGRKESLLEVLSYMREDPDLQQYTFPEKRLELWARVIENMGSGIGKIAHDMIPSEQQVMMRQAQMAAMEAEAAAQTKLAELQAQIEQAQAMLGGMPPQPPMLPPPQMQGAPAQMQGVM